MKLNKTNTINAIFYFFIALGVVAVMVAISNRWFIYNINVTHSLNGLVYVIHKGEPVRKAIMLVLVGEVINSINQDQFS